MKKEPIDPAKLQHAVLDLEDGGACFKCAYTIEHVGAKFKGVQEIQVDREKQEVHVDYDGNPEIINQIVDLVDRIGYTATPRANAV